MALLRSGLKGEPVRRLQQKLGIPADGAFGPKTEAALKTWQKNHGLAADGIAGPDTFMSMGLWELILLDEGSRGEAVKKLQEKVGAPADGVFGAATAKAVREYQKQHGLVADGKAGPATLAKMALFKEITSETVNQSRMPAGPAPMGEAPPSSTSAASRGEAPPAAGATAPTQAAISTSGQKSIWDTITSVFK